MDKPHKPTSAEIDDMMCADEMAARGHGECDWCSPEPPRCKQVQRPDVEGIQALAQMNFISRMDTLALCEYILWLEKR